MAAALEDTPVTYEDLADIERDFDDAETEIIRQQVHLTAPLYERRHQIVSQIPNFWPLVLEQAPPDIDQYIQPSDSALLLSSLSSLFVRHFELEDAQDNARGDPRSVSIRLEFAKNEYFEDAFLEKRFWWRRAHDGWCGLVSCPVRVRWRKGRDLTGGLLDLVCNAWDADSAREREQEADAQASSSRGHDEGGGDGSAARERMTPEQKALKKRIDQTGMAGLSFFAWFGFIGRKVGVEESEEATRKETERRLLRRQGRKTENPVEGNESDEESWKRNMEMSLEIFPEGDELALAITEDLWPGAVKYFIQAQEQDALSDADFESDEEEGSRGSSENPAKRGSGPDSRPVKKRRS